MFVCILLFKIDISYAEEISSIDTSIVSQIVSEFKKQTDQWYDKIKAIAADAFFIFLVLEFICTSIMAAFQQMEAADYLRNFVKVLFFGLIFLIIINNYQEWSQSIIFGLQKVAGSLTPTYTNEDNPFLIAFDFFEIIEKRIKALAWTEMAYAFGLIMTGVIVGICFALITANMIVIKCEVMVGLLAGLLLIPFGVWQSSRELAINAIKYAVSVGFKLFTMQLIIAIGYGFMDKLALGFEAKFNVMLVCIAFALILLCIVFTLPDTIASLVSSAHGSSGNMLHALNTVANATTAVAAGAMAIASAPGKALMGGVDTVRGGKELLNTFKDARGGGVWDTSKNIGKEALALRDQAKLNNSSIGKELLNRHNARKIQKREQ